MSGFFQELVQVGLYKPNQGRITRQVTFGAMVLIVAIGCWRLNATLLAPPRFLTAWLGSVSSWWPVVYWGLPLVLLVAGVWLAYRLVNFPRFADFLIAVEAEMNKVSWPSWPELVRGSVVVLTTMIALAVVLAAFDLVWNKLFRTIGIL